MIQLRDGILTFIIV